MLKKIKILLLSSIFIIGGTSIPVYADDSKTIREIFPDQNFAIVIATELGKNIDNTVSQEELDTIEVLNANDLNIKEITGLERLNNVSLIALSGNKIEDLSVFNAHTFPKLTVLMLYDNKIKDINPLVHLTGLDQVVLDLNEIEDVSQMRFSPSLDPDQNTGSGWRLYNLRAADQVVRKTKYRTKSLVDEFSLYDDLDKPEILAYTYAADHGGITTNDTNVVTWNNLPKEVEKVSYVFNSNYTLPGANWTYGGVTEITLLTPKVTVNYVDSDGKTLLAPDTLTGEYLGDEYETTPALIEGYQVDHIEGEDTGVYQETTPIVTYVYKPIPKIGKVQTHHKSMDGMTIADMDETTGVVGTAYSTSKTTIEGYELDHVEGGATGIYEHGEHIVTYFYKEVPKIGTVKTHHKSMDGLTLADTDEITGVVGTAYTTSEATIEGYELDHVEGGATGTYEQGEYIVTYFYKEVPKIGTVKTHHKSMDGLTLADTDETTGIVGTAYTTSEATIEGYELDHIEGDATGTYQDELQEVTYVYDVILTVPKAGNVKTHHKDLDGNTIADTTETSGIVGATYTTIEATIEGYELDHIEGNATGLYQETLQEVTYVYKAVVAVPKTGIVEVHYVNEEDEPIKETFKITGNIGVSYSTKAENITGYKLKKIVGSEQGVHTEEPIMVKYIYEEIKEMPIVPMNPTQPQTEKPTLVTTGSYTIEFATIGSFIFIVGMMLVKRKTM